MDGKPWRTVPDEVVLRCRLTAGVELDRPLLRRLRHELQHAGALHRAGRALARRPLSEQRLEERLERAGVAADARQNAVTKLKASGLVDDTKLARGRADSLAGRGWGNGAIAARLAAEGFDESVARAAMEALEPEPERAVALVVGVPDRRKAWALLARRGFAPDSVETAIGALDDGP
ncbi:MAG: regulatory protein RecX [Gaiellaceae bacterium]